MKETIVIKNRFCGPPDSGNGGYVCGLLARYVQGSAEVTLRKAPPLDHPLAVERGPQGEVLLQDGSEVVASARPAQLNLEPPDAPDFAAAAEASADYIGFKQHYFPNCFVCGPLREEDDGLRIFAGPLAAEGLVAAPWVPDSSLADMSGFVAPEFLWAALDCPGYMAVAGEIMELALLGRMQAEIIGRLRPGSQNVVIGWELGREGRKRFAGTAVYTAGGILCAKAKSTWIKLQ